MTEDEFNKKVKGTKTFCIFVGILFIISTIIHAKLKNYFFAVLSFAFIIILFLFYKLTKNKKIAGPIIGIILGSLYIVSCTWTKSALSIGIGLAVLMDSIAMLKYINRLNNN